ncbi:lactonase family protein [Catellatospora citrea]|uniref:lactonase family protein n=1 Tax=Catellatospora citrea TaxID=53366 RepID=UPI0033D458B5
MPSVPPDLVHIGSYTAKAGPELAITAWRQDPRTGRLAPAHPPVTAVDPSWLAWHPDGTHLYAASESAAQVLSYAVTGDGLRLLGAQPSGGADPCHLAVDPRGRFVVAANYSGGSVSVFAIGDDGALLPYHELVAHEGSGPDAERQESPHAHMALLAQDGLLYVTDLGTDEVRSYTVGPAGLRHLATSPLIAGMGPRHLAFHPSGAVFVAGELDSTVVVCEAADGRLRPVSSVAATVGAPGERNYPSHLECSPDGRFLYLANRGADCLTVFAVEGGTLRPVADVPTGRWPRHFALIGDFLYVADQDGDTVSVFRRDPVTGLPEPTGETVAVPNPSCVVAAPGVV